MSHVENGATATYNSLTDKYLSHYFRNDRIKRHLVRSGLVTKKGEIVPDTVYRVKTSRKAKRDNVRELLAQAIVDKSLHLEKTRQIAIKCKLEEIAKMELVRRVRKERHRKGDEEIIPLFTPRMHRAKQEPNKIRSGSAPHSRRRDSYSTDEGSLSDHGETGDGRGDSRLNERLPKERIDTRNLSTLDSVALREYAKILEQLDNNNMRSEVTFQPQPPPLSDGPRTQSRRGRRGRIGGRHIAVSGENERVYGAEPPKPDRPKGRLLLHRCEPMMHHQSRWQSLCEVTLRFSGVNTHGLDVDPRCHITVVQQHCGGNTIQVFDGPVAPNADFSFVSRRHRGYPFALTFYVNQVTDSRLSVCCEYFHSKGTRLGGRRGHFVFLGCVGAAPCYKCIAAKDGDSKKQSKKKKAVVEPTEVDEGVYDDEDFEDDDDARQTTTSKEEVDTRNEDEEPLENESVHSVDDGAATEKDINLSTARTETPPVADDRDSHNASSARSDGSDVHKESFGSDDGKAVPSEDHKEGIFPSPPSADKVDYKIVVKTADKYGAGTESRVTICIHGSRGSSIPICLNDFVGDASFQRASTVEFAVALDEIGKLNHLDVSHDSSGNRADWCLDKIIVENVNAGEKYVFLCNDWLLAEDPTVKLTAEPWHDEPAAINAAVVTGAVPPVESESSSEDDDDETAAARLPLPIPIIKRPRPPSDDSSESESESYTSASGESESESESEESDTETATASVQASVEGSRLSGDGEDREEMEAKKLIDDVLNVAQSTFSELPDPMSHRGEIEDFINGNTVSIYNTRLKEEQIEQLINYLKQAERVENLWIRNSEMDNDTICRLLPGLKGRNEFQSLNLNCNAIGPQGVQMLAEYVYSWSSLNTLLLHSNPIQDDGVGMITDSLIDKYHKASSESRGGDEESESKTTRLSIDFGDTGLTTVGALHVARLLEHNIPIKSMELSANRHIAVDGWREIGYSLATNNQLASLSADFCELEDEKLIAIIDRLSSNQTLKSLDVESNNIGTAGATRLRDMLCLNSTLSSLSLEVGNDIGDDMLDSIKSLTEKNV